MNCRFRFGLNRFKFDLRPARKEPYAYPGEKPLDPYEQQHRLLVEGTTPEADPYKELKKVLPYEPTQWSSDILAENSKQAVKSQNENENKNKNKNQNENLNLRKMTKAEKAALGNMQTYLWLDEEKKLYWIDVSRNDLKLLVKYLEYVEAVRTENEKRQEDWKAVGEEC